MKHLLLLLFPALLGGCVAAAPAPSATPPAAPAYARAFETDLLEFRYAYPAEVAAIPALVTRFRADEEKIFAEATAAAADDQRSARGTDRPFHGHYLSKSWETTGQSHRLLALVTEIEAFTGGAHGSRGFSTLLWDRSDGREIPPGEMFNRADPLQTVAYGSFCKALDAERLNRRQGEMLDGQFGECPPLSEVSVSPLDQDGDGRFDHIRFIAAPYVAGPWSEGAYEIDVPVGDALIEMTRLPYRASFEAHLAQ